MKKETMIAIAENLTNLSRLFAEAAGESVESKQEEKVVPKPDVKLEDIRAILAEKSMDGKQPQIRELLKKYGAERLSDVSPDSFLEMKSEAEAL